MEKPEKKTIEYLDWFEVQSYLEKKFPKYDWEELYDEFIEYGMVNNGCTSTYYNTEPEDEHQIKTYQSRLVFEKEFEIDDAIELYFSW